MAISSIPAWITIYTYNIQIMWKQEIQFCYISSPSLYLSSLFHYLSLFSIPPTSIHLHPSPPFSPGRPPLSPTLSRSRSLDSCREHKLQTMRRSGAPGGGSQSEEEALQSGMDIAMLYKIELKVAYYKSWGYL